MKVIVDANIVFSAILNTDSKIADLLLNSRDIFEFIAPDYLLNELIKFHKKISLLTRLSIDDVRLLELKVTKPISFISVFQVPEINWIKAADLVSDIDVKDTPYIAFSLFYNCRIWSGDKILRNGLINKGFMEIISTEELFILRESIRKT